METSSPIHAASVRKQHSFHFLNDLGSVITEVVLTRSVGFRSLLLGSDLGWGDPLLTQLSNAVSHALNSAETLCRARMDDGSLIRL